MARNCVDTAVLEWPPICDSYVAGVMLSLIHSDGTIR